MQTCRGQLVEIATYLVQYYPACFFKVFKTIHFWRTPLPTFLPSNLSSPHLVYCESWGSLLLELGIERGVVCAEVKAQPAASSAPFQPTLPQAPAPQTPQSLPPLHRPHKSTEEILKIFDRPGVQDSTFRGSGSYPFTSEQGSGSMWGSFNGAASNDWASFNMPQVHMLSLFCLRLL